MPGVCNLSVREPVREEKGEGGVLVDLMASDQG
jgi:hypothetical protein